MRNKVLSIFACCLLISFSSYAKAFSWSTEKAADPACNCSRGFADTIEKVAPAVVNISSKKIVKQKNNNKTILTPRSNFFDDFREFFEHFDRFFTERKPSINTEMVLLGSGFIIDTSGIIVTNYHVINNAQDIVVTMDDNTDFKAKVVGYDIKTDLAVLKINANRKLASVAFGNSDKARVGDEVIVIGNPFGVGSSATAGIISAIARDISAGTTNEFIQTDAALNRGNSGGPLFDLNGKVIGINTIIISPSESGGSVGVGFAIPSNLAIPIVEVLKSGKKIKHGWLGVQVQPITKELAESLSLQDTKGILVSQVVKDSPAEKGGIQVGDVLLEFDGKKVDRTKKLFQVVSGTEPEKKVQVKLLRKSKEVSVKVVVGESASDSQDNNQEENQSMSVTGLTISNLPTESKEGKNDVPTKGVIVTDVDIYRNSTLRDIKEGDIIVQINGADIENVESFQNQINLAREKDSEKALLVLIYRNGSQFFTSIKLAK
ncbi:MAG: Do family serine endopeptidase [Wolbachia sp.]